MKIEAFSQNVGLISKLVSGNYLLPASRALQDGYWEAEATYTRQCKTDREQNWYGRYIVYSGYTGTGSSATDSTRIHHHLSVAAVGVVVMGLASHLQRRGHTIW